MITLGPDVCSDVKSSFSREWLETNGIGGYASSTVAGANTRRYHGLLVAATRPPLGRMVLLSKFEESVIIGEGRFDLSCNQYPGTIHPKGFEYLVQFRLDPFPVWTYDLDGRTLERSLFMVDGENSTVCRWTIDPGVDAVLEVRPLLAFRDHHHLRRDEALDIHSEIVDGCVVLNAGDNFPALYLAHNAASVEEAGVWYRDLEYAIEQERGFDFREDLYQPCALRFDLSESAVLVASTKRHEAADQHVLERAEVKRRALRVAASRAADDAPRQQLVLAADQFIVRRGEGHTVIAGYHWFSDWGRDTMIALPGLTLSTGRHDIARSILTEFSHHLSEGMLPNRFPDGGEQPDYNTVDATLWYFEAVRAYVAETGDLDLVAGDLYEKLVDIIEWHVGGTRFGIRVDKDGLLTAGVPGVQLTWMDAKVGDDVITSRSGKAVEIQALWFNALCVMGDLADAFQDAVRAAQYRSMAAAAKTGFREVFWNDSEKCLYDVIDEAERDPSIRPNQIFAVSLRHTMLDAAQARSIVKKVEGELLTPYGLRSLSPRDPRYIGRYEGPPHVRDAAYHQGTVWSWLIGPFVDAYRRTHSRDPRASQRIAEILAPLKEHLSSAMLGQISEIFDGDAPHRPRGAAAQAWSVAALLGVISKP